MIGVPTDAADNGREYPRRPILGVGAVVLDGGRVLLVRRANEPLKGQWSLPGGAVELGETVVAAVAREVLEETGLEVEVGALIDLLDRLSYDEHGRVRYHYVLLDFVCRPVGGALEAASDAGAVCWAAIDALEPYSLSDQALAMIARGVTLSLR
jgi:ADP-ribose pyrophosphatase YjhB (NUDIX family)